ncbi:MAG: type III-B CRISPR module RAMP protein Cmr1 [Chitinophagales bacterium]|nr:type III-B CRISPR module RAMP protein Cmr1 [Chitinophagales bacterium]
MNANAIIKCKVTTPILAHGADGSTPELRAASIKGGLRYWFRAINCHLDLKGLYEAEGKLFGNTSKKSLLQIKVGLDKSADNIAEFEVLPHWSLKGRHSFTASGISPQTTFTVKLRGPNEYIKKVISLFEVYSFLGGIGKRSRRGMGSFMVTEIEGINQSLEHDKDLANYLHQKIHFLSPYFSRSNNKISNTYSDDKALYPWIKSIEFGQNGFKHAKDIIIKIGTTTSQFKKQNTAKYEASLGHASNGRFSSPIYVSIISKDGLHYPIITTLNTVSDKENGKIDHILQEAFKMQILQYKAD